MSDFLEPAFGGESVPWQDPVEYARVRRPLPIGSAGKAPRGRLGVACRRADVGEGNKGRSRWLLTGGSIWVVAAEDARQGDYVTANDRGELGARSGGRGKLGWRTIRGAKWEQTTAAGKVGLITLPRSGPRGGLPR